MTDTPHAFVEHSRELITASYLPRIELCLARLSDHNIWWRPNAESNSIGNLILHLSGNVRQWLVSGVGGAPDTREREMEFREHGPVPRAELLSRLRSAVGDADLALQSVDVTRLGERRTIQGCDVIILEAIYHAVEHFSMHTGQIITLTKMWAGDIGLYTVTNGIAEPTWDQTGIEARPHE